MRERCTRACAALVLAALGPPVALADDTTPGYSERVLQWTIKNGETCDDIASALYGSAKHRALVERYNSVRCDGKPLPDGLTLVVPAKVTDQPTARLRSMHPDVQARPPGGAWSPAASGMPLYKNQSVNTLDKARADILFLDRTRVVMAEHTLVVIYGTAARTAVNKTPPTVELESGEVQAGLAALRGKPVEVAVQGGRVSAHSRDAAVRSKEKRATVSVFDGTASVASSGKKVEVPKNQGTAFVKGLAPEPPRPLPPAPKWAASSAPGVLLAPPGEAVLRASWEAVPKAASYRVELARDPEFNDLLAREEVPADVRSFRGEKLPTGSYCLRVRAIDTDDFLGLASDVRNVVIAEARLEGTNGSVSGGNIEASRYGSLALAGFEGLELAVDDGPFNRVPARIDFASLAPKELAFRPHGTSAVTRYTVSYREPVITLSSKQRGAHGIDVTATLAGLDGVDVASRVAPAARLMLGGGMKRAAMSPIAGTNSWTASFPDVPSGSARVEIVDSRGRVLGSGPLEMAGEAVPEAPGAAPRHYIGISSALVQPSPVSNVVWWAPTPENAASVSATGYVQDARFGSMLGVRASGAVGAMGFDGLITTRELGGPPADGSAWFTLRWRPVQVGTTQLGPAIQFGVPISAQSPATRVGLGFAVGGYFGRATWLINAGGRAPVEYAGTRRAAPDAQGFLLGGGTYDLLPWARGYALLDAHAALVPTTHDLVGRGGLTLGTEMGGQLFAGVALRGSPWDDAGGHLMGQISLGVRER